MADALCGPSNALQSFRKHTSVDRTLQQDRLVGRGGSPAEQGFRTQDPRTGSLDAEFHAFEHAQPNPFQFQQPPPAAQQFAQHGPLGGLAGNAGGAQQGGWAADFQRMHISNSPSPIPVQQFRTEAPLVRSQQGGGVGAWHSEFMLHHGKGKEVVREASGYQANSGGMGMYNPQPSYAMGGQSFGFQQQQQQPLGQEVAMNEQQNDASFDAAFEEAMREMELHQQEADQQNTPPTEEPTTLEEQIQEPQIRIGSDAISYTDQRERTPEQEASDANELAKTAGHLLNLVSHDTSSKFQNSQFLDLMRRIRDREVEVQNNDLQSTTTAGSQVIAEPPTSILQPTPTLQQSNTNTNTTATDLRPHDPTTSFTFPDLNSVYAPTQADLTTPDGHPQSSWQNGGSGNGSEYTSAADEYPIGAATTDLHPGGRWYPEQKSPRTMQWELVRERGDGSGAGWA